MSQKNFNFFIFYLGFPFMIEGLKLSGEIGLGICVLSYISIDAMQTFDFNIYGFFQKIISFFSRTYIKVSGIEFELPIIEKFDTCSAFQS